MAPYRTRRYDDTDTSLEPIKIKRGQRPIQKGPVGAGRGSKGASTDTPIPAEPANIGSKTEQCGYDVVGPSILVGTSAAIAN
jgi:hypothetical protein